MIKYLPFILLITFSTPAENIWLGTANDVSTRNELFGYWDIDRTQPNVMYVVNEEWHCLFEFWMFEALLFPNAGPDFDQSAFVLTRRSLTEFAFQLIETQPRETTITGRIWIDGSTCRYEGRYTNGTQVNLDAPNIFLMCFKTKHCPEFGDVNGLRTFVVGNDDERITVNQLFPQSQYSAVFYDADAPKSFYRVNQRGSKMLKITCQPIYHVGGNLEPAFSCIHANPAMHNRAGETRPFTGSIEMIDQINAAHNWSVYE